MNQAAFTDRDWDDFIRYAAARPNGMEPIGSETSAQVWRVFADKVNISVSFILSVTHSLGLTAS